MKRILTLVALMGCLGFLMATPGPDHKVNWCHYPPGQWTGVPGAASHVLILSIDLAAQGAKQLSAHLGHSPSLAGGPACNPTTFNGVSAVGCAEGVSLDGTADGCPGQGLGFCDTFVTNGGCSTCPAGNPALCGICCA